MVTPMPWLPRKFLRLLQWAVLCVGLVWAGERMSAADPDPEARFLVLPYLQLPAPDSMTILWETNRRVGGPD